MRIVRIALAQVNSTVGDLEGNAALVLRGVAQAREAKADLVVFPELTLTGYPPEDLVLRRQFIDDNLKVLREVVRKITGVAAVLGFIDRGDGLHNAAAIVNGGRIVARHHKIFLPNYGVFDENRYFQPGKNANTVVLNGTIIGINICEDIWYPTGPMTQQASAGAEVILNINGSPYNAGKSTVREEMLSTRAADNGVIVAYLNMVGGQDELVFDGGSMVFNEQGPRIARARQFEEDMLIVDLDTPSVFRSRLHDPRRRNIRFENTQEEVPVITVDTRPLSAPTINNHAVLGAPQRIEPKMPHLQEVYSALVLGTGDYVRKTGFKKALIGLSGGIDSALTAAIAVDALGAENVLGILMPSGYSFEGSKTDAQKLAENLGIQYLMLPIEETFSTSLKMMRPALGDDDPGLAAENLQSRIRGNIMMTLSNKLGPLVLTTGNKSEMAVGYSTLYGDMAGGFSVLKDVLKTLVYQLCLYRNSIGDMPVIPQQVIDKPPSAELRPDQKDVDSLPPYEVLDPILKAYVEDDRSVEEMLAMGYERATIERVIRLVDINEYKRRQAPVGVKITPRAFGRDRRLPIANKFRESL